MKKLYPTILFITLLAVTGCKKESTDPQPNSIARTWQPQSVAMTAPANNQSLTIYLRNSNTNNLVDYSTHRMNLGADGVLTTYSAGTTDVGTWQLDKDQLTLNYSCCDKEILTVETATATNLNLSYTISSTTQKTNEQGALKNAQSLYGFDTSKGIKFIFRYTPL